MIYRPALNSTAQRSVTRILFSFLTDLVILKVKREEAGFVAFGCICFEHQDLKFGCLL